MPNAETVHSDVVEGGTDEQRCVSDVALGNPTGKTGTIQRLPAARSGLSETHAVIAMLERLAKNKDVDVAKMKEARELANEIMTAQRKDAFDEAMAAAQAEMHPVIADAANSETKSKYASHANLDRVLRPIYTRHGFLLTYDTEPNPTPEMMTFVCYAAAHGYERKYSIDLPVDGKGPKGGNVMSRTHAASSGVTYAMRILLKMVFNIAIDRDDDGNGAGRVEDDRPKVSQEQADTLIEKCEAVGCPRAKFLKWVEKDLKGVKLTRIEDIPAELFDGCMSGLSLFQKGK
jgi:hypothetical protein